MNIRECVKVRHSVRAYEDRPIDAKVAEDLKVMIQQCNREGDRVYLQNTANSQMLKITLP